MIMTHELELFPGCTVTLLLFKDVKNAAELRQKAVEGAIDGALINAAMVVDPFQILVAANKAVHSHKLAKMKTRSLYSEIIFNLSPTNNISDAFRKFGISDRDSALLIVLVYDGGKNAKLEDIISQVDGRQISVQDFSTITDVAQIKKTDYSSYDAKCVSKHLSEPVSLDLSPHVHLPGSVCLVAPVWSRRKIWQVQGSGESQEQWWS
ncbi:EKC/KEOPS complex subunit TPRKB isoform X3 [Hemitrygon akajei]|uniref:EKC/KEOPS complex subunit TPRKB isoform X3 n=2 Tax=Hemitrygon akajei TaxID=2704970 RepID=UPI003BF9E52E